MSNKKVLFASTMALLLAPAVLNEIAPVQTVHAETSIGTVRSATAVVDRNGKQTSVILPGSSSWELGKVKIINDKTYYQVATNEYVSIEAMDIHGKEQPKLKATNSIIGIVHQGGGIVVDKSGRSTGSFMPTGSEWKLGETINIGGMSYYQVSAQGYVSTNEVDVIDSNGRTINAQMAISQSKQKSPKKVGTLGYACKVVDANGKQTSLILPAGSSWQLGETKTINGDKYYQVATNEYIEAAVITSGDTATAKMTPENKTVTLSHDTNIVTDSGSKTTSILSSGSSWKVDQSKMMNGFKYYQVATNEWIQLVSDTTSKSPKTITLAKAVKLYNTATNSMTRTLPAKSSWRVSAVVKNQNGSYYAQVSNNEWLPLNAKSFADTATYYKLIDAATSEPYFANNITQ